MVRLPRPPTETAVDPENRMKESFTLTGKRQGTGRAALPRLRSLLHKFAYFLLRTSRTVIDYRETSVLAPGSVAIDLSRFPAKSAPRRKALQISIHILGLSQSPQWYGNNTRSDEIKPPKKTLTLR